MQFYLKGMVLEWFELDLLLADHLALQLLWQDNFKEFILEVQINFGSYAPIGDAEHQLDHLSMKDRQQINKYIMEFNRIALQIQDHREGALQHHFYNGLPDHIKDGFIVLGSPSPSLTSLRL